MCLWGSGNQHLTMAARALDCHSCTKSGGLNDKRRIEIGDGGDDGDDGDDEQNCKEKTLEFLFQLSACCPDAGLFATVPSQCRRTSQSASHKSFRNGENSGCVHQDLHPMQPGGSFSMQAGLV